MPKRFLSAVPVEPAFTDQIKDPPTPAQALLEWQIEAERLVCLYFATHDGAHQIHDAAVAMNIGEPPNTKAHWGHLAQRLHKAGDLVKVGATNASRDKTHGSLLCMWTASKSLKAKQAAKVAEEMAVAA